MSDGTDEKELLKLLETFRYEENQPGISLSEALDLIEEVMTYKVVKSVHDA